MSPLTTAKLAAVLAVAAPLAATAAHMSWSDERLKDEIATVGPTAAAKLA